MPAIDHSKCARVTFATHAASRSDAPRNASAAGLRPVIVSDPFGLRREGLVNVGDSGGRAGAAFSICAARHRYGPSTSKLLLGRRQKMAAAAVWRCRRPLASLVALITVRWPRAKGSRRSLLRSPGKDLFRDTTT